MKKVLLGFALMTSSLLAQTVAVPAPAATTPAAPSIADQLPHGSVTMLWDGDAPGAQGTTTADKPQLEFFGAPGEGKLADGKRTAVIVCPGGGYTQVVLGKEGVRIAEWLNGQGISAFVLTYRIAPKYSYPYPILDGQRAVRWVRAHAQEYGIAPNRIGVWGFSAGGHMVGVLGTRFDSGKPDASDPVERVSDRPDFAISSYGGLTLDPKVAKPGAMKSLLGPNPTPEVVAEMSPEKNVTKDTPPYFLYATQTDQSVPVLSSVVFFEALTRAGVPAEMHIFELGPHGTALGGAYPALSIWPDILRNWLRINGWLAPQK
jgi:acetyl esterase/lipase